MRIMLDTNVLFSAFLFPSPEWDRMMSEIFLHHTLVIPSYVIDELHKVVDRKFPSRKRALEQFLTRISYEMTYTPKNPEPGLVAIRDPKDYPVIYSAVTEDVDFLITGDHDFLALDLERPEIMTRTEFLNKIK